MKPQLVALDTAGYHNADLEKTTSRLVRGGSWKKQRIIRIIPAADSIPSKVVLSWLSLGFPPNNGVHTILALGQEVGDAYSSAIESVLAHPDLSTWEFVLTCEHDNAPPPDGVIRLVDQLENHPELACVGGLYFTKGEGGCAQVWGDPRDPVVNFRPQPPDPNGGLVECCGTGMGFNLFRLSMFKDTRIEKPLFKTLKGASGFATQDLQFWGKARKLGYRCAIDCGVKVGHYDAQTDVMW